MQGLKASGTGEFGARQKGSDHEVLPAAWLLLLLAAAVPQSGQGHVHAEAWLGPAQAEDAQNQMAAPQWHPAAQRDQILQSNLKIAATDEAYMALHCLWTGCWVSVDFSATICLAISQRQSVRL